MEEAYPPHTEAQPGKVTGLPMIIGQPFLFARRMTSNSPDRCPNIVKLNIHGDIRGHSIRACTVLLARECYSIVSPILQSSSRLLEALLSRLPVDDIPDGLKVFGLAVLVIKVVSVLPRINTEDGLELANNGILVCVCPDLDGTSLCVLNQPRPAGTLDACECGVELLLELVETAVGIVDGPSERTRWRLTAALRGRCQILPE
jgi:hypothetical protein